MRRTGFILPLICVSMGPVDAPVSPECRKYKRLILDDFVKSRKCPRIVIPVKTGSQRFQRVTITLDTGFHRCDDFLRERHSSDPERCLWEDARRKRRVLYGKTKTGVKADKLFEIPLARSWKPPSIIKRWAAMIFFLLIFFLDIVKTLY